MGQKVSPVGMRVGINRDWHSRWFANNQDFHKFPESPSAGSRRRAAAVRDAPFAAPHIRCRLPEIRLLRSLALLFVSIP